MLTIKHIAEKVGMSVATVSNVLNDNRGEVSEDNRQLILRTIEEMGYRPNRRARQLRKQANLAIAVQIDSAVIRSNVWRSTAALTLMTLVGINDSALARGYHISLLITDASDCIDNMESQILKQNAVDGLIFFGLANMADASLQALLGRLQKCKIPVVTIDRQLYQLGVPCISDDIRMGIAEAASRLAALGHVRGGYIGRVERETSYGHLSRFLDFQYGLADSGLSLDEDFIADASSEVDVYRVTRRMAETGRLPSFLIYSSDHYAMAGLEALQDAGIRVPEDVSAISVDNAPFAEAARVPLTTIDQNLYEQGGTLARVLLDHLAAPDVPMPDLTQVRSRLIERDSLGPALAHRQVMA